MDRAGVLDVVFVGIRVHPDATPIQILVVFGSGQWREDEEFQEVDWQLALDNRNIARDGLGGVRGESKDVAGVGKYFRALPRLQHAPILGYAILAFRCFSESFRVDAFEPDEHAIATRGGSFFDETRNLVAKRVDLHRKLDANTFTLTQLDKPVEDRFPVAVAREVVVSDEKAADTLLR